jgi:hypothetical protein
MRPQKAARLLNRGGAGSAQKARLFLAASRGFQTRPELGDVFALRLTAADTKLLADGLGLPITMSDMIAKGVVRCEATFRSVSATLEASHGDVFRLRLAPDAELGLLRDTGLTASMRDLLRLDRPRTPLHRYRDVISPPPTMPELIEYSQRFSMTPAAFLNSCRELGLRPSVEDVIQSVSFYCHKKTLYDATEEHGLVIPTEHMLERLFPSDLLVRHMWRTACPLLFGGRLPDLYGPPDRLRLLRARGAVRTLQRFARRLRQNRAARAIQRAWRRAVCDPWRPPAKRRLLREFDALRFSLPHPAS